MVNHNCCWCTGCWFQTLEKTATDNNALIKIASEDIQPEILARAGRQKPITAASKGSKTAPSANFVVKVSICCKKSSNVYFFVVISRTPLAPFDPYLAVAFLLFKTVTLSILSGLMVFRFFLYSLPSKITSGLFFEKSRFC